MGTISIRDYVKMGRARGWRKIYEESGEYKNDHIEVWHRAGR